MTTKKTTTQSKKTTEPATKATAAKATTTSAIKFTKGAYYEDRNGDLWCCTNAKTKQAADAATVVLMQATEDGQAAGDATEQPIDQFVKQLTNAELKEYRAVCEREREALAEDQKTPESAEAPKPKKAAKKSEPKADGKMSALDAAAKVLGEASAPMAAKALIEAMAGKGYWTSPGGKTPHATLYAAIIREITVKGTEARFAKVDRGQFTLTATGK